MAGRENQSGNVAPLKSITPPVASKNLANKVLIGLTTEEKQFEMNGGRKDQLNPLPYMFKKTKAIGANTDFGRRSRLANAFGPNLDLSWEKATAGQDGRATNTVQPATKIILFGPTWKDVPASGSDAVNSITQFMFDGESSSDDEDLE
jgi:hypothetical protein